MVSVFDISPELDISDKLPDMLALLPGWRRQKALSYRFDRDRFLCAKAYLMLEDMLRTEYGIQHCPEFSYGNNGKPYFKELSDIHFNMSHCPKGVACAVSGRPVGIDIEEIQFDEPVAMRVFNADEYARIKECATPAEKFTELWTMKESYLKLTGQGISMDLKNVIADAHDVHFETVINSKAGYVYTVSLMSAKVAPTEISSTFADS